MGNMADINIEQILKEIIAEIKKVEISEINFMHNSNFIEEMHFDSFEVVNFVDKLDTIFNIDFGTQFIDFDSLKMWSALLTNIKNKINLKNE